MDGVHLSQGYRATARRQFNFYNSVPRSSWYLFNRPRKDKMLIRSRKHPLVLNPGSLEWESSALTARLFPNNVFKKTEILKILYGFSALKT